MQRRVAGDAAAAGGSGHAAAAAGGGGGDQTSCLPSSFNWQRVKPRVSTKTATATSGCCQRPILKLGIL